MRLSCVLIAVSIVSLSCSSGADTASRPGADGVNEGSNGTSEVTAGDIASAGSAAVDVGNLPRGESQDFGPAPAVPIGDYSSETAEAIELIFGTSSIPEVFTDEQNRAIEVLGASGDPRVAWILMDMLRFAPSATRARYVVDAANEVTGLDVSVNAAWGDVTDHLIAWDIPAPPNYLSTKRTIYTSVLPEWGPLFDQSAESMDWRHVSWGGVRIDDRPFGQTDEVCNCIPGADDPSTQPAADADWLDDDDVVFGVVINGEARAYPRQIMEVREMVNDTLGGRDFAMPYCTLCGAAQVWFTDDLPDGVERPVLRTSGLLSRSNKVMYDVNTFSVFDTFLGTAQTGPLGAIGLELDQHFVVTSSWVDWKIAHPETDVLIEELALGRDFDFRNGRDADGPIFPVGDVDPRLGVHEDVFGVAREDGRPIAFHVDSAREVLGSGGTIDVGGISVLEDGGGLRAVDATGTEVSAHQAFWFAWSQFYEDTELWPGDAIG